MDTCNLPQSVASQLSPVPALCLTALLRLCDPHSTDKPLNMVWSGAVRYWLLHDVASSCLFSDCSMYHWMIMICLITVSLSFMCVVLINVAGIARGN